MFSNNFNLIILVDVQHLNFMCFINGFIFCLSCCSTLFFKIISVTAELRRNNLSNAWREVNQSDIYSFEQKNSFFSLKLFTTDTQDMFILTLQIHNIPHDY